MSTLVYLILPRDRAEQIMGNIERRIQTEFIRRDHTTDPVYIYYARINESYIPLIEVQLNALKDDEYTFVTDDFSSGRLLSLCPDTQTKLKELMVAHDIRDARKL